ncbi:MAG: hypothetical protein LBH48_02680 [Bifidobacteriaceae bacterium]|nr:hypothetical protein [Bifidobacteriaceae bacterium]
MGNPIGRDDFDRRWNELADQLAAEMSSPTPPSTDSAPTPAADAAPNPTGQPADPDGSPPHQADPPENGTTPADPAHATSSDRVERALEALRQGRDPWAEDDPSAQDGDDDGWGSEDWGGHPHPGAVRPAFPHPTPPPGPRDWAEVEDEGHFEPPEPPPVTAGEPLLVLAWAATFGGLLGLAAVVVFHLDVPWFVPRALGLLGAAGIATLIWRMPHKRSDSQGNGAQV